MSTRDRCLSNEDDDDDDDELNVTATRLFMAELMMGTMTILSRIDDYVIDELQSSYIIFSYNAHHRSNYDQFLFPFILFYLIIRHFLFFFFSYFSITIYG